MKKLTYLLPALALLLGFSSCEPEQIEPQFTTATVNASDAKKSHTYTAHLTPEEEVRTNLPPIDSKATGQIILKLSKDGTELYYKLIATNITDILFGHLHLAPRGENGPAVVDLVGNIRGRSTGIIAEGIITSASLKGPLAGMDLSALVAAIEAGKIYTNVHTTMNPGGEIRGQVK